MKILLVFLMLCSFGPKAMQCQQSDHQYLAEQVAQHKAKFTEFVNFLVLLKNLNDDPEAEPVLFSQAQHKIWQELKSYILNYQNDDASLLNEDFERVFVDDCFSLSGLDDGFRTKILVGLRGKILLLQHENMNLLESLRAALPNL